MTITQVELDYAKDLGPLGGLIGEWEGSRGDDVAPGKDRGIENSKYRETIIFTPIGRVDNHEQILFGLRYHKKAWRIGAPDPFHEDTGYMLWDAAERQVMRCFVVPRGIAVIAGGTAAADATTFALRADVGSTTYGICSNQFLDREFRTVRFDVKFTLDDDNLTYEEVTELQMKGRAESFRHTDGNTLRRVT
ncbi:MAG: heme-binding beta-barrel domain-containing protein [Thermoanaerobaculia bacterium]|jgi:hypothetical protein